MIDQKKAEVYMTDNLVKINLGFENVCGIDIPAKYIRNLSITGVTQHSSYDLNTNNSYNNHLYADSATFTVDYGELNKLDTRIDGLPIGKRIMRFHDIVGIDLYYKDQKDAVSIYMPWMTHGGSDENLWQTNRLYIRKSSFDRNPAYLKRWPKAKIEQVKQFEEQSNTISHHLLEVNFGRYNPLMWNTKLPQEDSDDIVLLRVGDKDDFTELYDTVKYDPNKTERISLTRDELRKLNAKSNI